MGARGNSGVIFSQIVRGFAEVLGQHDEVGGPELAAAFRSASDAAYRAVRRPVEGTMLTVVREMAEEAEQPDVRALHKLELLRRVVARGEQALAGTPDLLPVLKEAGVVDAGGAGLLEIIRGLTAGVAGEPPPDASVESEELSFDAVHQELSRFRYCTVFVVEGEGLDADALERDLERLGDSLLVVGDPSALKIHVHTDDPGAALSLGTRVGVIEGIEIANMHEQTRDREARLTVPAEGSLDLPTLETGVVAVVPGDGNRRLFESLRATRVIEGGQTMNPSTAEIHAAIEATPATAVVVLPNNKNVVLSAEQAAALASKPVFVVPTTTVQAGLAAIVAYDPEQALEANASRMADAQAGLSTGEVTRASRDVSLDGVNVRKGAWLGLADGHAVICDDDFDTVVDAVVARLLENGGELLTVLTGDEAPDGDALADRIAARHPGIEVEVHEGGQPHYPLLLSAE
jgi:DAK2 domain fusion protein YloV